MAIDDFGDGLDAASAQRLASLIRQKAGQVWLSTRRPEAARGFDAEEIVRLTRRQPTGPQGRAIHYGRVPGSRAERVAMRELHRQILPAMTAALPFWSARDRTIALRTGPWPTASTWSRGCCRPRPLASGSSTREAPMEESTRWPTWPSSARGLGFRVVALTDYDRDEQLQRRGLLPCRRPRTP